MNGNIDDINTYMASFGYKMSQIWIVSIGTMKQCSSNLGLILITTQPLGIHIISNVTILHFINKKYMTHVFLKQQL